MTREHTGTWTHSPSALGPESPQGTAGLRPREPRQSFPPHPAPRAPRRPLACDCITLVSVCLLWLLPVSLCVLSISTSPKDTLLWA